MGNSNDFIIENGVLKKYNGNGENVEIPDGVLTVGGGAFAGKNCVSVRIPETVAVIEPFAFAHCPRLSYVNLPKDLVRIEDSAFQNCPSLCTVTVPDGVSYIGTGSFTNAGLESVIMPLLHDENSQHPWGTFEGCKNLRYVRFTTNVDPRLSPLVLSQRATFNGCPLEAVYAPKCPVGDLTYLKAFASAGYAEMVEKGESMETEIADTYERYIKNQRKKLADFAMERPYLLRLILKRKYLSFTESADYLAKATEMKATEAAALLLEYQNSFSAAQKNDEEERRMQSAWKVPSQADILKKTFTTADLGEGVSVNLYKGDLTDVEIPDLIRKNKVLQIGEFAFSPNKSRRSAEQTEVCRRLERVVIGTHVQMICAGAFSGCERLSELVFNGPFPLICKGAFRDCKALADGDGFIILNGTLCGYTGNQTDVTIPEGVLSVSGAFGGYAELTSVKIPDTVKRIEADAFSGCKKLKELTVPAGVEYFDKAAVADCTRLKKLRFLSTQTQMGLDPIWKNKYLLAGISCKIIAPSGSMVEGYVKKWYPLQLITE